MSVSNPPPPHVPRRITRYVSEQFLASTAFCVAGGKTSAALIEEPSVTYGFALVPRDRRKMSRRKAVVSWEFILADRQM
jgi:hypothetical protein